MLEVNQTSHITIHKINKNRCFHFIFYLFICAFAADSWSISQGLLNNTRAQKWLVIVHDKAGVITQSTLRGPRHLNSTTTITSFTHRHAGIQQ